MKLNKEFENLLEDFKGSYLVSRPEENCPDISVLLDYVYDGIDEKQNREVLLHLASCTTCGILMVKIAAEKKHWELEMKRSPEKAISEALGRGGQKKVASIISGSSGSTSFSEARESLERWISSIWNPMWTGELVTAADTPQQTHVFDMEDGEYVKIVCSFEGQQTGFNPRVLLSWSANIFVPSKIFVHFVDSVTGKELLKVGLGVELEGDVVIEQPKLNFDPTTQRWGLKISTESQE